MNNFYIEKLAFLEKTDKEALEAFQNVLRSGKAAKGEELLSTNAVCKHIYILLSGAVRHFRLDEEGREFNAWFSFEGDFVIAMESFVLQKPSLEGMEILEDCEYVYLSHKDLKQLTKRFHSIESLQRQLMEVYFIEVERRLYRMQTFTAKKKYDYLLKHRPHFLKRIPQVHIASFLGVTKETLSRIRKKTKKTSVHADSSPSDTDHSKRS